MKTPLEASAGIPNAAEPIPDLVTGGQPSAEHFEALRDAGVAMVIDLRDPMEPRPFDEPALLARLGLPLVNVPVTAGSLDDATMERILAALRECRGKPVLLHCASGNRVGGPLIAYQMLDLGVPEEQAITVAFKAGLRSAEILQWGVQYAQQRLG